MHSFLNQRLWRCYVLPIAFLLLPVWALTQQTSWIEGVVSDGKSGLVLPGAAVMYSEGQGAFTSGDGRYRMAVPPGDIRLTCRFVGYREEVITLRVSEGETVVVNILLFPTATEMERVVVSAGRVPQRVADLTVSMSLIRPESIAATHITDGQELLSRAPGVEVLDGQASIRGGSGYSYGAGSRVMVLIDGLPMLSADAGHVRWSALPLENLSQIEIIKGAASVMYGSSALNGLIHFRTAEATTDGVTGFYTETGIFGQPRRAAWKWWDSPRAFTTVSASHLQRYGNTEVGTGLLLHFNNGYRRLNDDHYGRFNLMVRKHNQKVKGLVYGFSLHAMHNRKREFILWEDGTKGALKQDPATAQMLHGTYLTLDPVVTWRRNARINHALRNRLQLTRNDFPEGGANNSDAGSWYNEYQFTYTASPQLSLHAGASQQASVVQSAFYGDHTGWNGGAYVQTEYAPVPRLKWVAGTRIEGNSLNGTFDRMVPLFRTGVNYRAADVTFLRASFGQGYRYPSIAEKYAATTLGAVQILPNPNIKPEAGWSTELGVKQGVGGKRVQGVVDLALFYSQNTDMIEFLFGIYPGAGFGFRATNIEHSRVYGAEIEWMLQMPTGEINHTLAGGYVWMHPVEFNPMTGENTGQYLKFRRKHSFTFNLTSSYKQIDLSIHASVRSPILDIDQVFLDPTTREDLLPGFYDYWLSHNQSYATIDATIEYRLNKHYKVSVALRNLTNTEYMGRPGDIRPHRHLSIRFAGRF